MPSKVLQPLVRTDEDPLARVTAPPPNETPEERAERLMAEEMAKKVSDAIDEELNRQRAAEKKMPKPVKVLLLGQSESGKSTTLKNFQLMHSPKAFRAERASWRAVIQLNVVRSILLILNVMAEAQAASQTTPPSPSSSSFLPYNPPRPISSNDLPDDSEPVLTSEHLKLKMRLAPLVSLEEALRRRLAPAGSVEFEATHMPTAGQTYVERSKNSATTREVAVHSMAPWKTAFTRLRDGEGKGSMENGDDLIDWDNPNDPGVILSACKEDMMKLWADRTVKGLLEKRGLRLEEMAGFFLDCLERVAELRYIPSDDDILRARLKTLGVSEHRFEMKAGHGLSHDWRIYDVGGQRWQRATWVPFFDDVDSIIFLAPISCFDQVLQEDHTVNRLEDSYNLWKSIVSNQLLKHTNLVLFLNKCDILKAKLAAGIQLRKYVISYGDRPNDFENTSAYLKRKFGGILKEHSPLPRVFYAHFTSVTDTKSTAYILANLKDMLMRTNLQKSSLM